MRRGKQTCRLSDRINRKKEGNIKRVAWAGGEMEKHEELKISIDLEKDSEKGIQKGA